MHRVCDVVWGLLTAILQGGLVFIHAAYPFMSFLAMTLSMVWTLVALWEHYQKGKKRRSKTNDAS